MLHQLIHINFTTIFLAFFMIIFLLSNTALSKRITALFSFSIVCVFLLVIADSIEFWTTSLDYVHPLRVWVSAIGYTLRPITILNITLILIRHIKINRKLLIAPVILNGIISFSAIFSDLAFSYSADNQFVRGPLGLSAYIVSAFYLLTLLIITIKYFRERSFYETMIIFIMFVFAIITTYVEVAFAFEGFINSTCAVYITIYYLFFHVQTVKRDALTQAFNRRCFYDDAERHFSKLKAVISIDLNDLKVINDTQGHASGDAALCSIVDVIKKLLPSGCTLYRTGGDEFMILCFKQNQTVLEKFIVKIREEIQKTPYSCAIGLAMLEKNDTLDQICSRADAVMYKDKLKIKGARPR